MDSVELLSDRLAATGCGLRAWVCLCPQQRLLQRHDLLAMDALSRRRSLRPWRPADGGGLCRQAWPALPQPRQAAAWRPSTNTPVLRISDSTIAGDPSFSPGNAEIGGVYGGYRLDRRRSAE